jgi:hypothetical protein
MLILSTQIFLWVSRKKSFSMHYYFVLIKIFLGEPPSWAAEEKVDQWHDLGLDLWAKDSS